MTCFNLKRLVYPLLIIRFKITEYVKIPISYLRGGNFYVFLHFALLLNLSLFRFFAYNAPFCARFALNPDYIAHYAPFIWRKSPTNCDTHLIESIFQTDSSTTVNFWWPVPSFSVIIKKKGWYYNESNQPCLIPLLQKTGMPMRKTAFCFKQNLRNIFRIIFPVSIQSHKGNCSEHLYWGC